MFGWTKQGTMSIMKYDQYEGKLCKNHQNNKIEKLYSICMKSGININSLILELHIYILTDNQLLVYEMYK